MRLRIFPPPIGMASGMAGADGAPKRPARDDAEAPRAKRHRDGADGADGADEAESPSSQTARMARVMVDLNARADALDRSIAAMMRACSAPRPSTGIDNRPRL